MPETFDMDFYLNGYFNLIFKILINGEYDLIVCLFLIIQIINNKKLVENSREIKIINDIFELMINEVYKFMVNFLLTIYKSKEKYSFDLIEKYVQKNFPKMEYFQMKIIIIT
jgi:hypothetical protein